MKSYDSIVIGAGMSGLAAALRLSMSGQQVCLLEMHTIPGGLNSYYVRGKRQFDVGLHALTNFAEKHERSLPLIKLLRQLRIPYESFKLKQQTYSLIEFPERALRFSREQELLLGDIQKNFPNAIDGFRKLTEKILSFNEVNLNNTYQSARMVVRELIGDPDLEEMIFCPLLIYGSAWENDMDFSQFAIMFKAVFLEGFSRPDGGVRTIINLLLERLKTESCELRFKSKVKEFIKEDNRVIGVILENGEELRAKKVFSSIGLPETLQLLGEGHKEKREGKLSFVESLFVLDKKLTTDGPTIIFSNHQTKFSYQRPDDFVNPYFNVICMPDRYGNEEDGDEGMVRSTLIANYPLWANLKKESRELYNKKKLEVKNFAWDLLVRSVKELGDKQVTFFDCFSPDTITRYTGHHNGAVYGSEEKIREGRLPFENIYLCGTDQGFLGIVGAMLSGISIANLHGIQV